MRILFCLIACLGLVGCNTQSSHAEREGSASRVMPTGEVKVTGPVQSYADVVDQVAPAVVTVRSSKQVKAPQQFPFFNSPFFQQFFGGAAPQQPSTEVEHALGSGVVVRSDGYILTNDHVISGSQDIRVDLSTHQTYSAKVIGADAPSDLAVLKISANNLPVLHLGDSDQVRVGDVVLAVGNPLGVGESVTSGIISAKNRATGLGSGSFEDFLQTDAAINRGNSGGALVNTRAELIGINSQIISSSGGFMGLGFAIPSNMANKVMQQLISKGKVTRGMLGVEVQRMTSDLAASMGLKQVQGVLISSVAPGGPAARAGLKSGDVILQLNGKDVDDPNVLRNEVAATAPGVTVTLTILRDGKQQQVHATLGELTPQTAQAAQAQGGTGAGAGRLGIAVAPLTPDIAAQLNLPAGTVGVVVASVSPDGPAAQAGIQAGDVIQQVNHQPVHTPADVRSALAKSGNRPPLLVIDRNGQTLYVAVPLK